MSQKKGKQHPVVAAGKAYIENRKRSIMHGVNAAAEAGTALFHGGRAIEHATQGRFISALGDVLQMPQHAWKSVGSKVKEVKENVSLLPQVITAMTQHKEWYENIDLAGLVNLNYGRRKGIAEEGILSGSGNYKTGIPNVARIRIRLTNTLDPSDAHTQGYNVLYNRIRSANAGATNYVADNLDAYIWSVRNLRAAYAVMRRAYKTIRTFSATDATEPASLMAAQGLDYKTFSENAADLYSKLNQYGMMLRELAPLNCDLLNRTEWMFDNIFADSNDAKASKYVFSLEDASVLEFDGSSWTDRSVSLAAELSGSTSTGIDFTTFMTRVDTLFRYFITNNIFQIIAGDILKAYGESALFKYEKLDTDAYSLFLYDEAALTQIQNATAFGNGFTVAVTLGSSSSTGKVKTIVKITRPGIAEPQTLQLIYKPFVNFYKDTISPSESISATRLKIGIPDGITWAANGTITDTTVGMTYGTEVVIAVTVYRYNNGSTYYGKLWKDNIGFTFDNTGYINDNTVAWAAMDYAPLTVIQNDSKLLCTLFDWNNYARTNVEELASFNAYAWLSMIHAPRLIKQSNAKVIN